jgi:hypothetical protein
VWLKPHDRLARRGPFLARLLYVGPIMLAGPQSFMEWPAPLLPALLGSPAGRMSDLDNDDDEQRRKAESHI